jgi:hypothetical protein
MKKIRRAALYFESESEFERYLEKYNSYMSSPNHSLKKGDIRPGIWHYHLSGFIINERRKEAQLSLQKIDKERAGWLKLREEYARKEARAVSSKIDDCELQIKKLESTIKILRAGKKNYIKDAQRDYEKKNPFPREKERQKLLNKLNQ